MKKQILKSALIAMAGVGLLTGNAMADSININRPYDSGNLNYTSGSELSLQQVFDTYITVGSLDAVNDQSNAALWTNAEGAVDTYLVSLLTAGQDNLYIYSAATGASYELAAFSSTSASFSINNAGDLYIGGNLKDANFGKSFGFCYGSSCTEDSKNGNKPLALAYQLTGGMTIATQAFGGTDVTTSGGNDWLFGFEDYTDNDFQDAVFLVEDISRVPEPTTMLLFGTGLLGLATVARRRKDS